MSRARWTLAVALAAGVSAGCGTSPQHLVLDPARYATACTAAADCVPARLGDVCARCACPGAAISRTGLALLQADVTALLPFCGDPGGQVCGPCPAAVAVCDAGHCALEAP